MERLEGQLRKELRRAGSPGQGEGGQGEQGGELVAIVRVWPEVVGAENARRAWPARLARDGSLVVHASDSVWAFQLGMLAGSILERLVEALGDAAPVGLRFVPGPIPAPAAEPLQERLPKAPVIASEDAERGVAIAAAIEDEELREIVARAAAASLARWPAEGRSDRTF